MRRGSPPQVTRVRGYPGKNVNNNEMLVHEFCAPVYWLNQISLVLAFIIFFEENMTTTKIFTCSKEDQKLFYADIINARLICGNTFAKETVQFETSIFALSINFAL